MIFHPIQPGKAKVRARHKLLEQGARRDQCADRQRLWQFSFIGRTRIAHHQTRRQIALKAQCFEQVHVPKAPRAVQVNSTRPTLDRRFTWESPERYVEEEWV